MDCRAKSGHYLSKTYCVSKSLTMAHQGHPTSRHVAVCPTPWAASPPSLGTWCSSQPPRLVRRRDVDGEPHPRQGAVRCRCRELDDTGSIVVTDIIPVEKLGLYQPYTNIVYVSGRAFGTAMGGVMAETLGWQWEFGVQVPFLVLCIGVAIKVLPDSLGLQVSSCKNIWSAMAEFDGRGSFLLAAATTALILGLSLGSNTLPWSNPGVIALLATFVFGIPAFLRPRSNLLMGNFIAAMVTNSILFNTPIFYRAVLLTSASSSGLRLMLPSLVMSAVSALAGPSIAWSRRLKWPLVLGVTFYVLGSLCLCLLHRAVPSILSILVLVPSAVVAMLATSEQSEKAMATTTLLLIMSLGMVVGIASSSVVLQNALLYYLEVFVQGERKWEVISQVQASVEVVALLDSPYREQAVRSYESALRMTFLGCVVMGVIAALLIFPTRLPRLAARS
ncbi:Vacuolar basic amino acid transporter-like protein [Hapsidospora chrysogenum ATCC 11550]|uniref:Vacuolar basic amino acid transporter-like protein n=1 Tax=Hapsidospora chrysogenum (strain ATCC 11550 / CBS 779.69 / DSM 880 / IAM 14645 / JCM 23072 / IMI 49137) TaxID=857340 RepID=A0A086T6F4_HAPC1|nr:Vacuolar basic amino acid transporter-like protein [Hapsidospora chrysogenum ATCC 11550]